MDFVEGQQPQLKCTIHSRNLHQLNSNSYKQVPLLQSAKILEVCKIFLSWVDFNLTPSLKEKIAQQEGLTMWALGWTRTKHGTPIYSSPTIFLIKPWQVSSVETKCVASWERKNKERGPKSEPEEQNPKWVPARKYQIFFSRKRVRNQVKYFPFKGVR
jgi:hypothetical protein